MQHLLFAITLFLSSFVFAKAEFTSSSPRNSDPSLISVKYEVNPCYKEKSKSLSKSVGFYLMKDGSVVTSRHTRFVGPFPSIEAFKEKLDVCTYNHGKMGQGKKDYRIIHDDYLFSPEVTKFFSGRGGDFAGGGASGYWIGPSSNPAGEPVVLAQASK